MARVLAICQVYVPDPAAVGQHLAQACAALAARGHEVRVLTAAQGYDDPSQQYPKRERLLGVTIRRLGFCSFGKRSALMRLLGGFSFTVQAAIRGCLGPRPDVVLVSTAPVMSPLAAWLVAVIRRAELVYWVMDLNPDQAVALGHFAPTSLFVRGLDWMQRRVLRRARDVIVLDRYMEERLHQKGTPIRSVTVVPAWPHAASVADVPHEQNAFRARHGLGGKRVVMYSGNHGPSHPLDTLLAASVRLRDHAKLAFLFVGGGVGKAAVDAVAGPTIRSLPYQPLEQLTESLSAADVHVVTMGDAVVGINHPSKVYGAMAMSRPILFIGPDRCHVADILREHAIGWQVRHGDVERLTRVLEEIAAMPVEELRAMGRRAGEVVSRFFSRQRSVDRLCDVIAPRGGVWPAPALGLEERARA